MEEPLGKYTVSFGLALAITVVFSAMLVVIKELSEKTVMALMKQPTGHHWITHTIIDLIIFVVLGFLLTKVQISAKRLSWIIVGATVAGGVMIAGFYLLVD
jgi:undecaprenyl pyrophosphate phosphatase UppP